MSTRDDSYDGGESPANKVIYIAMAPYHLQYLRGKDLENCMDFGRDMYRKGFVSALVTPEAPVAPKRTYSLTLKLDADTLPELASALVNLGRRADRGELTRGVSGGPDSGYIYELLHNPEQTHETYFNQLNEYLARKKAEQERTCDEGCNGCDDCTDYEDDIIVCERCNGDGTDPMCDNLLPCPLCQG